MKSQNVHDPLVSKRQQYLLATQLVRAILKIDGKYESQKKNTQKAYLHVQKLAQSDVRNAGRVLAKQMHRWIEYGGIDRLKIFTKHCAERRESRLVGSLAGRKSSLFGSQANTYHYQNRTFENLNLLLNFLTIRVRNRLLMNHTVCYRFRNRPNLSNRSAVRSV